MLTLAGGGDDRVAVVIAIGFELYRRRTLFGKLGMAIAHDPEMASALGANT